MNAKYFWGSVTIVVIIGGTIYAIKKSKDAQNEPVEEISLEEARAIVARRNVEQGESAAQGFNDGLQEYAKEDVKVMVEAYEQMEEYDDKEEEEETYEPDGSELITTNGGYSKGEDELRYEPNSRDARNQFIKMELAEWLPLEDNYQTMLKLFEFPFQPQNDGDEMLRTQILDYRAQFFGFSSQWTKEITIADVVLHYGRAAEFQVGECVKYWVDYFLEFNEFTSMTPSHEVDDLLGRLNTHSYFNHRTQTFGLFGLTRQSMDQAIKIANRNVDNSVTYEIEFNEFLKSCMA